MRRPYGFILSNRMWILNFQERKDNFLIIKLISPLFPQKLTIISGKIRTPKINEALALTTMINKHLQENKKGEKSNKIDFSPLVNDMVQNSNQLIEDLKLLADILAA